MRKYLLSFVLALFAAPALLQAQPSQSSNYFIGWTVAKLPLATGSKGQFWPVMDGNSASDCTTGGGSTAVLCVSNGTAWVAVSGTGTYTLPAATSTVLGGVKPDGTSILNTSGAISATAASVGALPTTGGTLTGSLVGTSVQTQYLRAIYITDYAGLYNTLNFQNSINTPATFTCAGYTSAACLQIVNTSGSTGDDFDAINPAGGTGFKVDYLGNSTSLGTSTAAGHVNTTTPIRDETRFVLAANMTAVATAGVQIGSTGAGNSIFSWPVTAANWYDLRCQLPTTFATTATIRFELVSISGSVTISNVNAETMGDTGAAGVFQNLATVAGTSLAGSETPATGAPGASEQITYDAQFLTSHAGNIGIEFVANGTNNVTLLLGGECGITQIN